MQEAERVKLCSLIFSSTAAEAAVQNIQQNKNGLNNMFTFLLVAIIMIATSNLGTTTTATSSNGDLRKNLNNELSSPESSSSSSSPSPSSSTALEHYTYQNQIHHSNQHYHAACGTIASNNHTKIILKNPHHPEPTFVKAICETVIERTNQDIKMLKITFKQLELYRSSFDGTCHHDRFGIYTDLNAAITPILCGNQTGKSLSIPFEMPHSSLIVSITTSDLDHDRIWQLEIEQN